VQEKKILSPPTKKITIVNKREKLTSRPTGGDKATWSGKRAGGGHRRKKKLLNWKKGPSHTKKGNSISEKNKVND